MFDFLKKRYSLAESGVLPGSVDAHSHILFGVDDGSPHRKDSLEMLSLEESLGVTDVWCTPHIMEDVPNGTEQLRERFELLKSLWKGSIRLHLAAEYMMDNLFMERLRSRDLLYHGTGCVLVETSVNNPPYDFDAIISNILMAGITPMLAHPERYRYFRKEDYRALAARGVRLQMNLSSLTGYYGNTAREKAEWLLKNGLYSAVGSDCHRVRGIMEQYSVKALTKSTIESLARLLANLPQTEEE